MSNKQVTKRIYTGAMDEGTYRLARTEVTTEKCLDCADEIERLQSEIANDVIFKALRERIEQLEKERDFYFNKACNGEPEATGTWIRYDQIEAAWKRAHNAAWKREPYSLGVVACIEAVLSELGIVRCKRCGGRGSIEQEIIETAHESGGVYHRPCPDCNGHEWVKHD